MNHQEDNHNNKIKYIIVKKKTQIDTPKSFHTWKIAYADFMTALMSFFLLMWITSSVDDKTKIAIESYFNPFKTSNLSISPQGLHDNIKSANNLSNSDDKNKVNKTIKREVLSYGSGNYSPPKEKNQKLSITNHDIKNHKFPSDAHFEKQRDTNLSILSNSKDKNDTEQDKIIAYNLKLPKNREEVFQSRIKKHAQALQEKIRAKLTGLVADGILKGIIFQSTKTGMRISILDQGNYPMFEKGSSIPLNATILVIKKIGESLAQGNEKISIQGHTDAHQYYHSVGDNWKLSLDRAYNAYKILREAGISENRILKISGFADHHLKILSDPMNAANRRIEILVQDGQE